ncbi:MAG: hypothetical protein GEU90_02320 [Gemmatimonas sp.]|nr:hypothetical protein [Gemmatimonas sp.]
MNSGDWPRRVGDRGNCASAELCRGSIDPELRTIGDPELLNRPYLAMLTSRKPPPDLLLPTFDLFRRLREERIPVAGGFHGPLERSCLRLLLRGRQPVLICPARTLKRFRVPLGWTDAVRARRLLIVSELPDRWTRPSSRSAELRNDTLTRLASRIFVVSANPGSRTFERALRVMDAGKPVLCFDHPANRELLIAGARSVEPRRR